MVQADNRNVYRYIDYLLTHTHFAKSESNVPRGFIFEFRSRISRTVCRVLISLQLDFINHVVLHGFEIKFPTSRSNFSVISETYVRSRMWSRSIRYDAFLISKYNYD